MSQRIKQILLLSFFAAALTSIISFTLLADDPVDSERNIVAINFLSSVEVDVINEMNLARTDPTGYAAKLKEYRKRYNGNILIVADEINIRTREGVSACDETIMFLETAKPMTGFKLSKGLSLAAKDHVKDQGIKGATGHNGSDGSSPYSRMNRHGNWNRSAGENISYGKKTGEEIVIQLLIDDGVPGRGHRKNIFSKDFNIAGIGFGQHRTYNFMCVIDFAAEYSEK